MKFEHRPLWSLCTVNDEVLPESTQPETEFEYVDISSVTTGTIAGSLEVLRFTDAPSRARRLARPGDVIVSTVRTYLKAIAPVPKSDFARVYSTGFAVLRPDPASMSTDFFKYALLASDFINQISANSVGVSYPAINASELMRFTIPVPCQSSQASIATYLDRETAEIDAMLVDLEQLLDDLRERRLSATKHIFEELFAGQRIPIWSILVPIKDQNHVTEEVLSVYRDYGVILKDSRTDNHNRTPADLSAYQLVMPGDLVMNKMKAWQGSLGVSNHRGIVSPDYQVARPVAEVDPQYLHEVLRSPMMVPQYRAHSRGVRPSQWRLYWDDFSHLRIPLPDIETQGRIVKDLNRMNHEIEVMRSDAIHLKELLAERRTNLITEVVTGRKEIS